MEYDAYRCDVEQEALAPQMPRGQARLEQARKALQNHQDQYHQARDDLQVKLQLLQENKVGRGERGEEGRGSRCSIQYCPSSFSPQHTCLFLFIYIYRTLFPIDTV